MWTKSLENYPFVKYYKSVTDAFTDTKRVTKSHIPALNVTARIEVPNEQTTNTLANEYITHQKRGRPISSKDKNLRKKM